MVLGAKKLAMLQEKMARLREIERSSRNFDGLKSLSCVLANAKDVLCVLKISLDLDFYCLYRQEEEVPRFR